MLSGKLDVMQSTNISETWRRKIESIIKLGIKTV